MTLYVQFKTHTAQLPQRAHPSDAGYDLCADEAAVIPPGESRLIKTGIALAIDAGKVGLIWPRSGLDARHDVTTGAGVIDSGYRGEICVLLRNHGRTAYPVQAGDRIAQLILTAAFTDTVCPVTHWADTDRGANGFGSTGR